MEKLLFSNIEKFKNRIAFIDENEKKVIYKDVLSHSEDISEIIYSRSLIKSYIISERNC